MPDPSDPRTAGARYYDLQPFEDDLGFYRRIIGESRPSLLELGCGTGRVMLGLADLCTSVNGIELSSEMLAIARAKDTVAAFTEGDVRDFELGRTFDLILAPYRVFQALESDREVDGMLRCVRKHLAPGGACIITMFMTRLDPATLRDRWGTGEETEEWSRVIDGDRGDELIEESVMPIAMRCWYPDQITALLENRGFRITASWGGYDGEAFGDGPELIVRFEDR